MYLAKYAVGELNHPCRLAMRLASDHFVDTSSFETTKNRAFSIYRWQNDLALHGKTYSGFIPWLHYYYKQWTKYALKANLPENSINGKPMIPMHCYFKDLEEFKAWLGDDGFRDLLVDLL